MDVYMWICMWNLWNTETVGYLDWVCFLVVFIVNNGKILHPSCIQISKC